MRSKPTFSPRPVPRARAAGPSRLGRLAGHSLAWLACGLTATGGLGCNRNKGNAASQLTKAPTMTDATGEAMCGVKASAAKPLIIEWPATERAALEAQATRGLVAVRYEGCEMEVLTTCIVTGTYEYVGTNKKREGVKIKNADDLYAQLPVGAAGLEAKLERSGQLNIDMMVVGHKIADRFEFNERDLDGRCGDATHVVTGLTVGAFSFYTGTSAGVGAGVKIGQVGVGARSSASQEVLKQDGDEDSCALAEQGAAEPPAGCGALLKVEVVPIDKIFGRSATASTSPGSLSNSSSSNPTQGATTTTTADRMAANKSARTWTIIGGAGYAVALVGMSAALGGYLLRAKAKTAIPESEAGDARQSEVTKYKIGGGLALGGLAAASAGFIVGVLGVAQAKKARSIATVAPAIGPGFAGATVNVSF